MAVPLITVASLEKTYLTRAGSRIRALADVTLDVAGGESICRTLLLVWQKPVR